MTGMMEVSWIFPGQGSQYINMLRELSIYFPEARRCLEEANEVLRQARRIVPHSTANIAVLETQIAM